MGLFITILVGIIAGYVAAKLMKIDVSFWIAMLLGIAGSIVGGWVTSLLLGVNLASGFNLTTILVSIGGAVLVVLIYRLFKEEVKTPKPVYLFFPKSIRPENADAFFASQRQPTAGRDEAARLSASD